MKNIRVERLNDGGDVLFFVIDGYIFEDAFELRVEESVPLVLLEMDDTYTASLFVILTTFSCCY